jgi:hypothetical protein
MPTESGPLSQAKKMKKIARTGLLLFSSAALGGVAVVLWSQRTLAKLREAHQDLDEPAEREPGAAGERRRSAEAAFQEDE